MGITPVSLMRALEERNKVVRTGRLTSGGEKIQIYQSGTFRSLEDIRDMVIRPADSDQLVRLGDIADVRRTTPDPPDPIMRFNMKRAIGIGISTVAGGNTIVMGDSVKAEIRELMKELPAGLKIHIVNFQGTAVKKAINRFITGLIQSILIVIVVLVLFLGFRSSLVIVNGLLFNIAALFIIMRIFGVNLQNVSIAALILALGMMVDDSVVISDNILVRLRQGNMDRDTAGVQSAKATGFAQFIATFIIVASFLPIYLAESATGVFCESLFLVVAIALSVSWFQAMTVVPVVGGYLFKVKKKGKEKFSSRLYRVYRDVLRAGLRHRWAVIGLMVALLVISNFCFGFIKQDFFPLADRAQFQVNYWNPQGTGLVKTSEDLKKIEKHVLSMKGVRSVATSVGSGPPRFLLGFTPQQPNPSYGCIIVNTETTKDVPVLIRSVRKYLKSSFPQANPVVSGFTMGGAPSMKIEARFFGPDPDVLRDLAGQAMEIMREQGGVDIRDNWRQKVKVWEPEYVQSRGLMTGITREDIGRSLLAFTTGLPVGVYRKAQNMLPILLRFPAWQRKNNSELDTIPVSGQGSGRTVPLGTVTRNVPPVFENPIIHRLHRMRYISALCNPPAAETSVSFRKKLLPLFKKKIDLPPGYRLKWGGTYKMMKTSNDSVNEQLPVAMVLMVIAIVILFNDLLRPVMLILTLPLSIVGIAIGMLLFGKPFDFMANLGFYCLIGIMIRNGVILILEIDSLIKQGKDPYESVVEGSVSRLRPVLITALCTSLAMIPLIGDRLFGSMAVTITAGLIFATIITLVYLPVLYAMLRRIPNKT
jgi:multidrug efflux pump subunit AcrB